MDWQIVFSAEILLTFIGGSHLFSMSIPHGVPSEQVAGTDERIACTPPASVTIGGISGSWRSRRGGEPA